MEVTGRVHRIGKDEQVSATFKKRELVVATDEQYPQFISINFVQDKVDLIDPYKEGENVTVSVNLRGREWVNPQGESKYFNDIQGWRIQRNLGGTKPNGADESYSGKKEFTEPLSKVSEEEHDDLPF